MTPERWQRVRDVFDEAVERPAEARTRFLDEACATDADLRREVEALLAADARTGAALDLATASKPPTAHARGDLPEAPIGQRLGAYELVGLIGQGGMGAVYRAVRADDQFHKQVAVKLVRRGLDSEQLLRRFQAERQILATLEHPYVARLLDAGATPDGRPYLVMEHVDGRPIERYCHEERLDVAARLRLFLKVCEAVAYAHRHLVVHRDLKPANILVLADGTPRLLDFGIAKLLEPGPRDEATATGLAPMTPEYASPEQVRGERVTTASDVYALGVLLYELLCGARPYTLATSQPQELLRVVCATEPFPPSARVESEARRPPGSARELRRALRGDLDNVVMMALRKEPERRYGSVEQLARDLERHLDGRPVRARADTFWYRSSKFVRRNRLGTALLALLLAWVATASYQVQVARRERARAERRLLDVRRLAQTLLFELHDAVQPLPGSTRARELIVGRALEYLDGLRGDAGDDPALRLELGQAYTRIGEIQYRVGAASLGDSQGALRSYDRAAELLGPLCSAPRPEREACRGLAQVRWLEGTILKDRTDLAGALERYGEALRLDQALLAQAPGDRAIQRALVDVHRQAARALAQQGQRSEGLGHQREAVRLAEALGPAAEAADLRSLSLALSDLAEALSQSGDFAGALALFDRCLDLGHRRRAQEPKSVPARRNVGVQLVRRGAVLVQLGELERALADFRQAQAIARELSAADADNAVARDDLAQAGTHACEALLGLRRLDEAARDCPEPLRIWRAEHAAHPTDDWAWGVAIGHYWAGQLARSRGEWPEAGRQLREYLRLLQGLGGEPPSAENLTSLAAGEVALAELETDAGHWAAALRHYERALELGRPREGDPLDQDSRLSLASAQAAVAGLHARLAQQSGGANRPEEERRVCSAAAEAQRLYRLAEAQHPLPPPARRVRAELERRHGACFAGSGS